MAELVPSTGGGGSILTPLRNNPDAPVLTRLRTFAAQPPVRKALPWFVGVAGVGLLAVAWATLMPVPQRTLYASLDDGERAAVVDALDKASIAYRINNTTGALTVGESDVYRARMVVAQNGAIAAPETGDELLNSLPMGASRTLEDDRLRAAQERDLALTIKEIDGVDAVRVHLARGEKSVFVRENIAPSASVMLRMARGRQLSETQVQAIANLVAASVPGLSVDAVRIVDQQGRLLWETHGPDTDQLELQSRMEAKLRTQVEQLLSPMVGADNFSSEIQVDLNMDEVTQARENYDKDGSVRNETTQRSQGPATSAIGVPGVLSNTPPPAPTARPGAPAGGPTPPPGQQGESSDSRTYELGREVSVSNLAPGGVKRISVAVALDQAALKGASPADIAKFEQLVSAAVGADKARGDTVAVVVRPFRPTEIAAPRFWETGWFLAAMRDGAALIAVILVLLIVVRPLIRWLTGSKTKPENAAGANVADGASPFAASLIGGPDHEVEPTERERLSAQIELAQRIVREQPGDALLALRRMLDEPADPAEPVGATA